MENTQDNFSNLTKYFTDKILAKDYELIAITSYIVSIKIDDEYKFNLWIGNAPTNFQSYSGFFNSIHLIFSEENQEILHKDFNNLLNDKLNLPEAIKKRKAEYEKLKLEFEPTEL